MSALSALVSHDQDSLRCPADIYRELRGEGVRYAPEPDAYMVARHDDVVRVLRDGKTFSSCNTVGCIGAALARLEGRVVVELLDDFALLAPQSQVEYQASFVNHGPLSLPARLTFRTPRSVK
jgi:cytochrome P450